MITDISLDVRNTLVYPNSFFARKRNIIIGRYFGIGEERVYKNYTRVKQSLDLQAASGLGRAPTIIENLQTLYEETFNKTCSPRIKNVLPKLQVDIERAYFAYPPLIPNELILTLKRLSEKGIRFHIISNTNFIGGRTVDPFLRLTTGVNFVSSLYSDEVGYSKPNRNIFVKMLDKTVGKVIHFGDNQMTAGEGAKRMSIEFCLVSDPGATNLILTTHPNID
jgi:FMN phosphatase YigB (HAD superfamily)